MTNVLLLPLTWQYALGVPYQYLRYCLMMSSAMQLLGSRASSCHRYTKSHRQKIPNVTSFMLTAEKRDLHQL
ncbi:hypothetical protein F4680DRAFT_420491 [Xylaria scruposa]|nr:hypothetical protein F4680DRAFT_420491 [Xylaria scruposa]